MINMIILLLLITLIKLLKQRKLDFKYSVLIFIAFLIAYLVDKQMRSSYLNLFTIGGTCAIMYSFCILTAYKKKLVRLIQEKAILKYDLEKRL